MSNSTHIVAIGGLPLDVDHSSLLRYLLDLTGKSKPAVGFVGTASGDNPAYIDRFHTRFSGLDCVPSHLPLFARTPSLEEYLEEQDVLLIGGGNTKSMLAAWRDWELPELLHQAWERGTVLAGWSAGAICWFEQGVTDSYADRLDSLACLGFLEGSCCPHYTGEPDRRPAYHRLLCAGRIGPGYALDDGAGLHFEGGEPAAVLAPAGTAGVHHVFLEEETVIEEPVSVGRIDLA